MSIVEVLAIMLAGVAAGTINTVVGSGTMITFPTLLFFGYPAVTANMSNSVGLVAGGISGSLGYRRELAGAGTTLLRLAPATVAGAVLGAVLLLVLPEDAFVRIVPVLIGLGLVLVLLGPALQRRSARHHLDASPQRRWQFPALFAGIFGAGVYGGYFGAAQGVILIGLLSALSTEPLQRLNGYKNVLGTLANAVAALAFMVLAWDQIDWVVAALIALGALAGGVLGARIGRRLPPAALRAVIVVVGVVGIIKIV